MARAIEEPSQEIVELLIYHLFFMNKVLDIVCFMARVGGGRIGDLMDWMSSKLLREPGIGLRIFPRNFAVCALTHIGSRLGARHPVCLGWRTGPRPRKLGPRSGLRCLRWGQRITTDALCALPHRETSRSRLICALMARRACS